MVAKTAKEQICINQVVGQKREVAMVEGDVIVNDIKPDILNIISSQGTSYVYKKEIVEGKVRLDGSINTYIIYLADDENGSVRTLNTILDFTKFVEIENIKTGMAIDEEMEIKNFDFSILNSRKINIKANVEFNVKVYASNNVDIINNVEDLQDVQILKKQTEMSSLIGQGETKTFAKETIVIEAADDLAEIMQAKFKILNKEAKISYNKVLARAELNADIMYLTEDNRVNTMNANLPIMGFVDIQNVNDSNMCDVKFKLKNIIIKPNNGDSHSIYIEAEVEIMCFVFEMRNIDIIEDLYSTTAELNCKKKQIRTNRESDRINAMCNIQEQIMVSEIGSNKLYSASVMPTITNMEKQNGKILFEGELALEFLFESNNIMDTKEMTMPFTFVVENDLVRPDTDMDTNMEISRENFTIVSDGNIELDVALDFNMSLLTNTSLEVLEEIMMEESRDNNIYSMVIYFVKSGDSLWKIAKKLKSTVSDIARVNGIEENSTLSIGQQLYIPKYVRQSIEIA